LPFQTALKEETMKKISLTALSLLILTACATEPVTAYRWHRTGASEAEVSRQINTCKSQVQNGTKRGASSKTFEQCMDEAGYYSYEHGNL
jgi:hypothetical protein